MFGRHNNNDESMIYIGIDPSLRASGQAACIIDTSAKTLTFKVFVNSIKDFLNFVQSAPPCDGWVVENSNLQNTTFEKYRGMKSNVLMKVCRDVGKNQAASLFTIAAIEVARPNEKLLQLSPQQKGAKVPHAIFAACCWSIGITPPKTSNQDQRDAFMLAFKLVK